MQHFKGNYIGLPELASNSFWFIADQVSSDVQVIMHSKKLACKHIVQGHSLAWQIWP